MNKTHFFLLLLACLFLSCTKKKDRISRKDTNKINSISVIIDDQLWYGEVGDSIRNKFASPVIGLTKEEPQFTINQYPAKIMEGFMTNSRNLIVVKKANYSKFEVRRDEYTKPQNVFRITGKTISDILKNLEINAPMISKAIKETEIAQTQKKIKQGLLNQAVISNKFHINIDIPLGYKYVMHRSNFIWMKREIIGGNTSLLLYQIPLSKFAGKKDVVSEIVKMRDSIGEFITGKEPNTPMITQEAYSPYFSIIELDGKKTYETKGSWELKNDFMMGPFINYAIIDEAYNRVLVLEGFSYSPSNEERDLMFELEAIIKSVVIDKR